MMKLKQLVFWTIGAIFVAISAMPSAKAQTALEIGDH